MKTKRITAKSLLVVLIMSLCSSVAWAQNGAGLGNTNPPRYQSNGSEPLDIVMISGMVLHPVWLTASSTKTNFTVVEAITTEQQLKAGDALNQNNRISDFPNERKTAHIVSLAPSQSVVSTTANTVQTGMAYADCDEDNSTFQSSAAKLDFGAEMACTTIEKAFLYWSTASKEGPVSYTTPYPGLPTMNSYTGSGANIGRGSTSNTDNVWFKPPGETDYIKNITGTRTTATAGECNTFVADVTQYVQGKSGGYFWVANVASDYSITNASTGWSLVVIFRPPNAPPRSILLVDGAVGDGSQVGLNLSDPPATANSISYLGYIGTDSEDFAYTIDCPGTITNIVDATTDAASVRVQPNNGPVTKIQQFLDQAPLTVYDINGGLYCSQAYDSPVSSTLTTFDKITGKNGASFLRLPDTRYTAGYDAHHIRLPQGAITANANKVTLTLPTEVNGSSYSARMAYLAIETLQANLKVYMQTDPMPTTVPPGGQLTYEIKVENIGTLATTAGAYVENPLPIVADLQNLGTIQVFDKNGADITGTLPAPEVTGEDTDNESLKIYLPIIAAGDGIVASDSVTIRYTVDIKDLSRTDIYSYGCNRYVMNVAKAHYTVGAGTPTSIGSVPSGTLSQLGCDADGIPVITEISSQALEDQYKNTHTMKINSSASEPAWVDLVTRINNSTIPLQPQVNIVTELKAILAAQYAKIGLDPADLSHYAIYRDGIIVNPGETFVVTPDDLVQQYTAEAVLPPNDCEETFIFDLELAKIPTVVEIPETAGINDYTDCVGCSNGKLEIEASNGTPGYLCIVTDASNNEVYRAYSTSASPDYTFVADGLPAGTYDVVLQDYTGQKAQPLKVVVSDPDPVVVNLTAGCNDDVAHSIALNASGTSPFGNPLDYVWQKWNGVDWDATGLPAAQSFPDAAPNATYRVVVCDGSNFTAKEINLPLLSVPDEEVSISSTPPHTTIFAAATTIDGIATTDSYSYNWEVSNDNGATWTAISSATISGVDGTYSDYTTANLTVDDITLAMNDYRYRLTISLPEGCVGMTQALLTVTEGPRVIATKTDASCANVADGTLQIQLADGEDAVNYTVNIYKGKYDKNTPPSSETPVATGTYTTPESPKTIAILNDLAGSETGEDYTVEIIPDNSSYSTTYYSNNQSKILAPEPIIVNVVAPPAVCEGTPAVLNGMVTGGPASGSTSYEWQMSLDDINYSNVGAADQLSYPLSANSYFRLIGKVGTCADTSTVSHIENRETPQVEIYLKVDSGCFRYNLDTLKIREKNGASYDKLTLHRAEPTSAIDNSTLIPEKDYVITRNMVVYARMSNSDLCYTVDNGAVYIKAMDECYPITMPVFFSPDGDGINDYFRIEGLEHYLGYEITIYDRYGKEVFRGGAGKIDYPSSLGWDGKYLGNDLPSGDYWYQMTFTEIPTKVGYFALKRKKE